MLGLAIPSFNRTPVVLDDSRIGDIVIVDDGSKPRRGRVIACPDNLGCYLNKRRAVQACEEPWVILLDSDNKIGAQYLDALIGCAWDPRTLYLPVFAKPNFDYRAYAGLTITAANVAQYADKPRFFTALNTGNFVVNKAEYLAVFDDTFQPLAADSIYFCYCWLKSGRSLHFLPGLVYDHAMSKDSNYLKHAEPSQPIFRNIEQRLRMMK